MTGKPVLGQYRRKKRESPPPIPAIYDQQSATGRQQNFRLLPGSDMVIAQALYEAGHITYMRTDSAMVASEAQPKHLSHCDSLRSNLHPDFATNLRPPGAETPRKAIGYPPHPRQPLIR